MRNAMEEKCRPVTIRGQKGLFGGFRVNKETLPEGLYAYEIRHTDDGSEPCEMTEHVLVNFMGTVIFSEPFQAWDKINHVCGKPEATTHQMIFQFYDVPEWYENEDDGITEDETDENGNPNEPHFCPLDSEWDCDYDEEVTIEEFFHEFFENKELLGQQDDEDEFYFGYVYDQTGHYDMPYVIKNNFPTIARFIMMNPANDKVITDALDQLVVSTFGPFLNKVNSDDVGMNFLEFLRNELVAYQTGAKSLVPLTFVKRDGTMVQEELLRTWDAVFVSEEEQKHRQYELYKLQWMMNHGFTINDLMNAFIDFVSNAEQDQGMPFPAKSLPELFNQWEEDAGFGGELWASHDEWLENEGADEGGTNA